MWNYSIKFLIFWKKTSVNSSRNKSQLLNRFRFVNITFFGRLVLLLNLDVGVVVDLVERLRLGLGKDQIEHVRGHVNRRADQEDERPIGQLVLKSKV